MTAHTTGMPKTTKKRGEYSKSAARRSQIVDAALEVFGSSGYRAGSLREIADRVGMTEAGILHHFPSKKALLLAVLMHRDDETVKFMRGDTPPGEPNDLSRIVRLAERNASLPGVTELFAVISAESTSPSHVAHDYFADRYRRLRMGLYDSFSKLKSEGLLHEGINIDYAVASTAAIMDGLQIQWLFDRTSVDMAAILHEHLSLLVEADALNELE